VLANEVPRRETATALEAFVRGGGALLVFVGDNARQFTTAYGNISGASIGAIQRALLELEQQGGASFFGEPMLDVDDLTQTDGHGQGIVNVLVGFAPLKPAEFVFLKISQLAGEVEV